MTTAFHALRVGAVARLTDDAVAIDLDVPPALASAFAFAPGQSVTVRRGEQRRSYSLCSPAGAAPRIGVRAVAGGAVSSWLVHEVRPGDTIEVQAPAGSFTPVLDGPARHVLVGAGSGITPLLSIASSVLAADAGSTVTLLYGNRRSDTVMFADEVAELKDAHPTRMRIVHVLSREAQEVELHNGRLDRAGLERLLPAVVDAAAVDHWWLCGPFGMVTDAQAVLAGLGVPRDRVHRELFWVGDEPPSPMRHPEPGGVDGAVVTVVLDGRSTTVRLARDQSVLDGAQRARPDLPYACRGGVCGTCRARVVSGSATMRRNYALEADELDTGYVLTCQAVPTSDELTVDFDG